MSGVTLVVLGSSILTVLMSCASIHFSRRAHKSWEQAEANWKLAEASWRQQAEQRGRSHVDFTIGGNKRDHGVVQATGYAAATAKAVNDEMLRRQQSAEKTVAWKPFGTGENLPRRRWWQRPKV